jgi:hypothetical protein
MTVLDQLRGQLEGQGRAQLTPFMEPPQLDEFQRLLGDAQWFERQSRWGRLDCLDPSQHGLITGRIGEFLSQPAVMQNLGAVLNQACSHFVGNIVRQRPDAGHRFQWRDDYPAEACAALCVNLGPAAVGIATVDDRHTLTLAPGDASLMTLTHTHQLQVAERPGLFIEGVLIRR